MWACTHTHGGPETGVLPSMGEKDPDYLNSVEVAAVAAALDALDGMTSANLWLASGESYMGANRRSAAFRPGGPEDGHIDDIDAAVVVAEFRDPGGNPIVTLVNYSCHPTGSRESVSTSDYPGHMRRTVSAATGAPSTSTASTMARTDQPEQRRIRAFSTWIISGYLPLPCTAVYTPCA